MILAFFAASDGIVLENLGVRFMGEVQLSEARAFYGLQIAMENIHSITYSTLIDTYIKDKEQKHKLFNALNEYECIKKKGQWAIKWINDKNASFASRLVAFAIVEGIFFSSSFASIYWIKKRGLMPGLTLSNEFISRDEALHCEFAILLYSKIKKRVDEGLVHKIFKEAVNIEKEFIINSLPCKLIGINADLMSLYIEFLADKLCNDLGYLKIYNSINPFGFMENINLELKNNFFENRTTTYQKIDLTNINSSMTDDF
jgi:ribonucleotide reductase beta subunit family protein with ferritin-like domain